MTPVRTILPVVLLAPLFLFNGPAIADTEVWICTRVDGTEVFTNRMKLTGCKEYTPQSELGYVKRTVEQKEERKPSEPQVQLALPPINITINVQSAPPPPRLEMRAPVGEIPFQVIRMLSVGMSEAEVLSRAGLPQFTLIGSQSFGVPFPTWPIFGANRFVYSSGDWIVEVTFGGGRVISINEFRPRP
jgi:hypothetical protein